MHTCRLECAYTILQKRLNFKLYPAPFQFFVNNADFYVNNIMLTASFSMQIHFIIFDYSTICSVLNLSFRTISWFCRSSCKTKISIWMPLSH